MHIFSIAETSAGRNSAETLDGGEPRRREEIHQPPGQRNHHKRPFHRKVPRALFRAMG